NGVTTATFSISTLAVGTHTVTALYSGDSNFSSSTGALSGGQVVTGTTPSNAAFVTQVYLDLLHRPVDQSGLAAYTAALDQGTTRFQVALVIATSLEYRINLVDSVYQLLLGRAVDPFGLVGGIQFLEAGATDEQFQATVAGSQEYFQNRGQGTNAGFL